MNENLLWKKQYGQEWHISYKGTLSKSVLVDDFVCQGSGDGVEYYLKI